MIRMIDSTVLAWTKLRLHKIRTGIAVGVSGLVFGFLLVLILAIQGIINSVDLFSEGFNSRYIVQAQSYSATYFEYGSDLALLKNPEVIKRTKEIYNQRIVEMKAEAKRLNLLFDPSTDEPSPILVDPKTKVESIGEQNIGNWAVQQAIAEEIDKLPKQTVLRDKIGKYQVKQIYQAPRSLWFESDGSVAMFKNQREIFDKNSSPDQFGQVTKSKDISFFSLDSGVADSFISTPLDSVSGDEVPVIIPSTDAEKLLDLKALGAKATNQQRIERAREINSRSKDIKVSFCYRNASSLQQVQEAKNIQADIKANKNNSTYQKPSVVYEVPSEDGCEPVKIVSDTRSVQEKKLAESLQTFHRKFDNSLEPVAKQIDFRVVGTVPNSMSQPGVSGVSQVVASVMSSNLQFQWTIPSASADRLPTGSDQMKNVGHQIYQTPGQEEYLIEFQSAEEATRFMRAESMSGMDGSGTYVAPFANASLFISELNSWIKSVLPWVILVVATIASLILTGVIGRTVADGRKETAVFRAIGATRGDISAIYATYTLLLAMRIVVFALVLAFLISIIIQMWLGPDATLGARLTFNVLDDDKYFSFVGINNWHILVILGAIVVSSFVAMLFPLVRNVRRNPINDMRDDS